MTLEQIKSAVSEGKTVHWKNDAYLVTVDGIGQWFIACHRGSAIGLTWRDGVTLNGKPEDFFVGQTDAEILDSLFAGVTE